MDQTPGGWLHCVAWDPSGSTLAFASHAGSVAFVAGLEAAKCESWRVRARRRTCAPLLRRPTLAAAYARAPPSPPAHSAPPPAGSARRTPRQLARRWPFRPCLCWIWFS